MSTPARPGLNFPTLDALSADVERLKTHGYTKAGQWELATILDHITKALNGPQPGPVKPLIWPLSSIARVMIRRIIRKQKYPTMKMPAPGFMVPSQTISLEEAYPAFRSAVERVQALPDNAIIDTKFARVPKSEFVGLHLLHSAHHLSFLRPNA